MNGDELPKGWEEVALQSIAEVRLGRQRSPDKVSGDHVVPYLRAANVTWTGLALADVKEMNFSPAEQQVYALQKGDLLLSEASGSASEVGKPAMWNNEMPFACFQNTLIRIRLKSPLAHRFYYYFFLNTARSGAFADAGKGIGINHLGADRMTKWPTLVPPLPEQHRIVAKLDSLLAKSRRAREALDAIPPLLEQLRQSVLASAFRGDLTADWRAKNPEVEPATELLKRIRVERRKKWEEAELAKMKAKGKTPTDDKWKAKYVEPVEPDLSNGVPDIPESWQWVSVSDIAECLDSMRVPLNRDARDKRLGKYPYYGANGQVGTIDEYIFDDELVLVTEDETFYGRTKPIAYRTSGKCWVNNHAHVLRAIAPVEIDYIWVSLMHYRVEPWLSGTTGRAKLTQGALNSLPIPLPPLEELQCLTQRLRQCFLRIEQFSLECSQNGTQLDQMQSVLLSAAFRGELVPQDPSDEPASVMLERLRAERDSAGTVSKKRGKGAAKVGTGDDQKELPGVAVPSVSSKRGRKAKSKS